MRKNVIMLLSCVLMGLTSFALTLKVGIYDNPPISYFALQGAKGILVQFLDYVAQREDWSVSYVHGTLNVLLNDLKSGKIDVILGVVENKELDEFCDFTRNYFFSNWGQVYAPLGTSITSFFDLKGKNIGVLKGGTFYKGKQGIKYILDHLGVRAKFIEFTNYQDAFRAAESHVVDAVVANGLFGNVNAFKYDLEITPLIFSPVEERIAFSKRSRVASGVKDTIESYLVRMKKNPDSILNISVRQYLAPKKKAVVLPGWVVYVFYITFIALIVLAVNVSVLRKLVDRKTKEIEKKNQELNEKNEELTASNEEISAMNEELENTYKILEELSNRFQTMLVALSQLDVGKVSGEKFLKHVLDSALKIVPYARCGSVSILEKGKWKLVEIRGSVRSATPCGGKLDIQKAIVVEENGAETLFLPLTFSGELLGCLAIALSEENGRSFTKGEIEILEKLVKIATAFYVSRKYVRYQRELQDRIVMVLVKALEKYDKYTQGHSARVAKCSRDLAKKMGLDEKSCRRIYQAGLLHDIGKLFVSADVLNKNGPLTEEEYEEIKKHPTIGADLIEEGAKLQETALIVRHHHEKWNGQGYPAGLKGEEIPMESRIMAVCDAYDSMVSDRPYRKALNEDVALREIMKNAGTQFDPEVVRFFLQMKKNEKV